MFKADLKEDNPSGGASIETVDAANYTKNHKNRAITIGDMVTQYKIPVNIPWPWCLIQET